MVIDGRNVWTETHIDEVSLKEVAKTTGGKYYRAKNKEELEGIYDEIAKKKEQVSSTTVDTHLKTPHTISNENKGGN